VADAGTATGGPAPLLVFADDWGRHPSSCQHLVRHLLGRREALWVDTIGTRPPRLDRATLARAAEKLRQWGRLRESPAGDPPPSGLRVLRPKMWPWFRSGFDRRLNRHLLASQLGRVLRARTVLPIAVTTLPIVADLVGVLPVGRWVYYCVDDFSQWPGLDGEALGRMERDLVDRADVLVAAGPALRDRLVAMGRDAHLLTHGIDREHWIGQGGRAPAGIEGLPRPLIVFWGVVDRRMDPRFLARLASDLESGTIVLAGPVQDSDPALDRLPRLARIGPVPYEQLPGLAREASVLVMPYADLPVTRAMEPLKLKEYLATGRPVVASDLPAARPWADALDLAASPEMFSAAVRDRLASGLPDAQRAARARLADEGWDAKALRFERWITAGAGEAPEDLASLASAQAHPRRGA
jgi:glycosyltransferase involved in cell wall biosynthesis